MRTAGLLCSKVPFIRIGGLLATAGLATACMLAVRLPRNKLRIAAAWCWLAIIVVGVSVFTAAWLLGGSAVSGTIVQGHYYVMEHGQPTEVSIFWYALQAALELLMFLLLPAGIVLATAADKE